MLKKQLENYSDDTVIVKYYEITKEKFDEDRRINAHTDTFSEWCSCKEITQLPHDTLFPYKTLVIA